MENFKNFIENPESVNISQVWKTLKKMSPKQEATLPTAKSNHKGKIVTGPSEIKRLMAKEYKYRHYRRRCEYSLWLYNYTLCEADIYLLQQLPIYYIL